MSSLALTSDWYYIYTSYCTPDTTNHTGHILWKSYLDRHIEKKSIGRWWGKFLLTLEDSASFDQFSG